MAEINAPFETSAQPLAPVPMARLQREINAPFDASPSTAVPVSDHLVIIPTFNRPDKLRLLLNSMLTNMKAHDYKKRVRVVVVDDSQPDNVKKNRQTIQIIQDKAKLLLEIIHYRPEDQRTFLDQLSTQTGKTVSSFVYPDQTRQRKTFGGVRNMASLIALRHANENSLVTFLDDDTRLLNAVFDQKSSKYRLEPTHNYFANVERAFSDPSVNMVGGEVTGDGSGGTPFRISNTLAYINRFFTHASAKKPNDSPMDKIRQTIKDAPRAPATYAQALRELANLTHQLRYGRDRFNFVTVDLLRKKYGFATNPMVSATLLPGANTSFRTHVLRTIPYMMWHGRGEDVINSQAVSQELGGTYIYENPVFHSKDPSERRVVQEAVADMFCTPVLHTFRNIDQPLDTALPGISAQRVAPVVQDVVQDKNNGGRFDRWRSGVREIQVLLDGSPNAWWNQKLYAPQVSKIRRFLGDLASELRQSGPGSPEAQLQNGIAPERLSKALQTYGKDIRRWQALTRHVQTTAATAARSGVRHG